MGSDTRAFLACSAASSSAFRFLPTSEVLQDKGDWLHQLVIGTTPGDSERKTFPHPAPPPKEIHRV